MGDLTNAKLTALDQIADKAARAGRKGRAIEPLGRNATDLERWAQDLGYREGHETRKAAA